MTKKYLTTIPFQGFYCSVHDSLFDHVTDYIFEDSEDSEKIDRINWQKLRLEYSKNWIECINHLFDLDLKFESLKSSKYYNYETDRIFGYINKTDYKKIQKMINSERFNKYIKEQFTSRSGFISFYSNKIEDWKSKNFEDYDHNEIGSLLSVYLELICDAKQIIDFKYFDSEIIEDQNLFEFVCNNIICNNI